MKILFTTFYDPAYLGIRYLAANLLKAGHEVRIVQLKSFRSRILPSTDIDAHTGYYLYYKQAFSASGDSEYPITPQEMDLFGQSIAEWKPDIAAFTLRSPYNHLLPAILPVMREAASDAFLLGGGFGPTFNPELPLGLGADAVIQGEGEGAILELTDYLAKNWDWHAIRNLAYVGKNGDIIKNPLRSLITDLDSQPFALQYGDHFVSIEDDTLNYDDMRLRTSEGIFCQSYVLLTSRGCIGHCSYCAGGNWRNQYTEQGLVAPRARMRSLDNVMAELRVAKEKGETVISFADEYLVRPYDELCAFFERYAEEIDLPFYAHFHHAQLMTEKDGRKKLLEIARDAGLTEIPVGVQSGSEEFAAKIYHRQNKNNEMLEAINCFQKYGFSGNYHIIGGNPLESAENIEELYNFCRRIPFDPSLKTQWSLLAMKLKLLDGSPLVTEHPELLNMPYDTGKFTESILLADLANKLDEESFTAVRNDPFYRDHPERLHYLLLNVIRERHQQYLAKEIKRLAGRKVYFWGCGEMFHYKAHLFKETEPICILDDIIPPEKGGHNTIRGLTVYNPSQVLPGAETVPIVVFSAHAPTIYRNILKTYPRFNDIVTCALI